MMYFHIEPCQIMFIYGFDMSCAFRLCKSQPVMRWSVCHVQSSAYHVQRVCLSCAMTAIVIHACHNDVIM